MSALTSFESDLVSLCMKDKEALAKFSLKIKPGHIRNKSLRWIYEVLINYFFKFKSLPDIKVFKNELMKTSLSEEEKKQRYIVLRKLLIKKIKTSAEYIEKDLSQKIEREELLSAIESSVRRIEEGKISEAKKELARSLLFKAEEEEVTVRLVGGWKERLYSRKEARLSPSLKIAVSTPYSFINTVTKGIQAGEIASVSGLTGIGKSIIAGEFGSHALLERKNVLHFSLENTAEQTATRYDSRLSDLQYDLIKSYRFSPAELKSFVETFKALSSALKNDLVIVEKPTLDIIEVERIIHGLWIDGFNVDFLIIDSCDLMKATRRYEARYLERASIYWDFKVLCKKRKIPGLTTTQLKVGVKNRIASVEDLAEAYEKARILDISYIMSQTEELAKENLVFFQVGKNRDGPTGASIKLWRDGAKVRFLEVIPT